MPSPGNNAVQPPLSKLGLDLLELSRWQVVRSLAGPFLAFVAYIGFAITGHWCAAIGALVVQSFVTYGSTSHDLVHGSLGLRRGVNDVLLAVIEGLCLRSGHAYQLAHLHHHARFPHDDDVEARAARHSFGKALLDGVTFQIEIVAWALAHPRARRRWIVAELVFVLAIVAGSIALVPWTIVPTAYVVLMIGGSWIIPLMTSYIPHNPDAPDRLGQTRLFRGPIIRLLAVDHLYHLEHHLYPAVPHQNWPELAARLDPWLDAMGVVPVTLGPTNPRIVRRSLRVPPAGERTTRHR